MEVQFAHRRVLSAVLRFSDGSSFLWVFPLQVRILFHNGLSQTSISERDYNRGDKYHEERGHCRKQSTNMVSSILRPIPPISCRDETYGEETFNLNEEISSLLWNPWKNCSHLTPDQLMLIKQI